MIRPAGFVAVCIAACAPDTEPLLVAVAGNFAAPAHDIAREFSNTTGVAVNVSSGATGHLFAQITNGARYDVFLAADQARPDLLIESGRIGEADRFDYATGRLALVFRSGVSPDDLGRGGVRTVAIANPETAPYGRAASEVLHAWEWERRYGLTVVYGANVSQAFQMVASGASDAGLVALSLVADVPHDTVAPELHDPIVQGGAVLSPDDQRARRFVGLLMSDSVQLTLRQRGYAGEIRR